MGQRKGQRTAHSAPGTGHFCISCRVLSRRCKCTTSRGVLEFGRALKAEDTLGSCSNENHPWMGNQDCCSEWKTGDSSRPGYTLSMFQARHPLESRCMASYCPTRRHGGKVECQLLTDCWLPPARAATAFARPHDRTLFRPHKNFGIPVELPAAAPISVTPTKRGTANKLTILPPIFESQEGPQDG